MKFALRWVGVLVLAAFAMPAEAYAYGFGAARGGVAVGPGGAAPGARSAALRRVRTAALPAAHAGAPTSVRAARQCRPARLVE